VTRITGRGKRAREWNARRVGHFEGKIHTNQGSGEKDNGKSDCPENVEPADRSHRDFDIAFDATDECRRGRGATLAAAALPAVWKIGRSGGSWAIVWRLLVIQRDRRVESPAKKEVTTTK
jgi:hypothetical protein